MPQPQPSSPPRVPVRQRSARDMLEHVPVHVVWEITLACDLKCGHCGSRAGKKRSGELTTEECFEVVDGLERLGTREVSMIGGEAYLRRDWPELVRYIKSKGMRCLIQTGGRNFNAERLQTAIDAGLDGVGVSIDGMRELHDRVRGVPGSWDKAFDLYRRAREAGLQASCNTQIGAETMADLPALMDTIIEAGATHWQIQLTVAMGNAVDNDELLLQPHQLAELMPLLARLFKEGQKRGLLMVVGNNIGYFGPYEHLWRGYSDERVHWTGCSAGQNVIALEADGSVKGCPSLPTVGYTGGNVRDAAIEDIWGSAPEIHFGRLRSTTDMWGFCGSCYYNDVCRAGCTWTSHSLLGRPGNNPYCHHRVIELAKQGLRERITKVAEAADDSFAFGGFEVVTETIPNGEPSRTVETATPIPPGPLVQLRRHGDKAAPDVGRLPPRLTQCRSCRHYVYGPQGPCHFCGEDLEASEQAHRDAVERRRKAMQDVVDALSAMGVELNL